MRANPEPVARPTLPTMRAARTTQPSIKTNSLTNSIMSATNKHQKRCLKIGFLNICHLYNKHALLADAIHQDGTDIMCLAETFLTDKIQDSEIAIPGFTLHRKDRSHALGGGVAIYCKNATCQSKRRHDLERPDLELLLLEVKLKGQRTNDRYTVCCHYRPPSSNVGHWEKLSSVLQGVDSSNQCTVPLVLVGDFNVDISDPKASQKRHLSHFCQEHELIQRNLNITRPGKQSPGSAIDLVMTRAAAVSSCSVRDLDLSDHFAVFAEIPAKVPLRRCSERTGRNWLRVEWETFSADLANQCLSEIDDTHDIDKQWEVWLAKVTHVMDAHAPSRTYRPKAKSRPMPWMTNDLLAAQRQRDKLHRACKKHPDSRTLPILYHNARKHAKQLLRRSKSAYYKGLLTQVRHQPREAWKVLNQLTCRTRTMDEVPISPDSLSHQFNSIVTDRFRPPRLSVPHGPAPEAALLAFIPPTVDEVHALLAGVSVHKATGSDGLPCVALKMCSHILAPSLATLFANSLQAGHVPKVLKIANISPIYKSGDKSVPKNYRPVSLLPVVSKLLEKVVQKQLVRYLSINGLLPEEQFAFRSNHSTEDCLTLAVDRFLSERDSRRHTGMVLVDMSKAFDKVHHQTLINDLHDIGIASTALSWFHSYLEDRFQRVVLPGQAPSHVFQCQCGVPQGSVLGPILFVLYTKNIPCLMSQLGVHCQLFADDIMLDYSSSDLAAINSSLSTGVSKLADWLKERNLILNETKTQVLGLSANRQHITLNVECHGTALQQAETAKYLGVTLDDRLNWHAHVTAVTKKVAPAIRIMWRARRSMTRETAKAYYTSIISPLLLYGSNCFGSSLPATEVERLRRLSNRGVRCIARQPPTAPSAGLYRQFNLVTPERAAKIKLLGLLRRCAFNTISPQLSRRVTPVADRTTAEGRTTRGCARDYIIPRHATAAGHRRPLVTAVRLWNKLPAMLKTTPSAGLFQIGLQEAAL